MVMLMKDQALDMLESCQEGKGSHAWKKLNTEYEGKQKVCFAQMLQNILSFQITGDDILRSLESWERDVRECEKTTSDTNSFLLKAGLVIKMLPPLPLSTHVVLNSGWLATYDQI